MARRENSFNFVQETPSATWTIVHNLGRRVIVDCFVTFSGSPQTILPVSITHEDDNTSTVTFSVPRSGTARCI